MNSFSKSDLFNLRRQGFSFADCAAMLKATESACRETIEEGANRRRARESAAADEERFFRAAACCEEDRANGFAPFAVQIR